MGEAVEQGRGHLGVAEDGGPFTEAQVGGDDDAGALVEFAQQVEEQGTARCAEGSIVAKRHASRQSNAMCEHGEVITMSK